ncbi:uncharacterized protein LOC116722287 isoform X2 [Xiphophorus hellerii]|uniref:uncharacterized protein LOC116722287 isoform X2 n=1 Tax=Xiphophorus hellerii TaxID=8084 RepID=UPI0013B37F92|nr:uncharacterized protein LOC116722287 isoform X2 [Xiphophorus hellerii]
MKFSTMFYTVFDLNGMLEKTMKGADKAIVAKSFGKWKSSSLRSRTMEKPDEPSEESKKANLSNCTCEDPQLAKKPVDNELHDHFLRENKLENNSRGERCGSGILSFSAPGKPQTKMDTEGEEQTFKTCNSSTGLVDWATESHSPYGSAARKRSAQDGVQGAPVNKRKSLLMKPRHYSPSDACEEESEDLAPPQDKEELRNIDTPADGNFKAVNGAADKSSCLDSASNSVLLRWPEVTSNGSPQCELGHL